MQFYHVKSKLLQNERAEGFYNIKKGMLVFKGRLLLVI